MKMESADGRDESPRRKIPGDRTTRCRQWMISTLYQAIGIDSVDEFNNGSGSPMTSSDDRRPGTALIVNGALFVGNTGRVDLCSPPVSLFYTSSFRGVGGRERDGTCCGSRTESPHSA